jgi:phosphohistidine phosphatase SixA
MKLFTSPPDVSAKLGERLNNKEALRPDVYLTSTYRHAVETAEILRDADAATAIIEVPGLTPDTSTAQRFSLAAIREDAVKVGANFNQVTTVALVGHEDRLSNLAGMLTGTGVARLDRLEALVLEAESIDAAIAGHAVVTKRIRADSVG